jgi:rhodanese-related sulfurtransferase
MKLHQFMLPGCLIAGMTAAGIASADLGNRYGLPQIYHSEVSAAEAYTLTSHGRGNKRGSDFANAVIIDVRRVSEHVAGHPPKSYSIPFPHVSGSPDEPNDSTGYIGYDLSNDSNICFVDGCDDGTNEDGTLNPADFVSYVESLFPDKSTPILTLCRTGYRSVQAANLLTASGYENVRNIWEGFVGQPKYAYDGGSVRVPLEQLDLNHDNSFDDNDKDGWAYYQGLPVSTEIHPQRIFSPYIYLYYQ